MFSATALLLELLTGSAPDRRVKTVANVNYAGDIRPAVDAHTRIHRGEMFRAGIIVASVANDASIDVVLTTPADDWPHIVFLPALDGSADAHIYEAPTFTGGTPLTVINHKRYSVRTWGGAVVHTPTVTDAGTQILGCHIPGGTGPQSSGSGGDFQGEFPLKPATSYLFRLTNRAGQSKRGSVCLSWYTAPEIPDA